MLTELRAWVVLMCAQHTYRRISLHSLSVSNYSENCGENSQRWHQKIPPFEAVLT